MFGPPGPIEILVVLLELGVVLAIILYLVRHHRDTQSLKRSVERLEKLLEKEKAEEHRKTPD